MAKIAGSSIDPPSMQKFLLEIPATLLSLAAFWEYFAHSQEGNKDHAKPLSEAPIVVVPGFLAPNITTLGLRNYFERAGHPTDTPDIWLNHGGRTVLSATEYAINRAADKSGKPVVAVGHSLGGAVCLLAAYREAALSHVVTLGSPLRTAMGEHGSNYLLRAVHGGLCLFEDWAGVAHELYEHMKAGKPPVPLTAIRARGDGIVAWKAAEHPWGGKSIEVAGSHCGLVVSRDAAHHVKETISGRKSSRRESRGASNRGPKTFGLDLSAA